MERVHPNKRRTVFALRAALILALAGCSNQQMSASNPFMSPDRVPPPATRTIAPGTAAPYYPGDPIPAAQNAPPGMPAPPMVAQAPPNLAPAVVPTAIAPVAAATAAAPLAMQPGAPQPGAPQPLAFSNDRTVAIPTDSQDLRFALPSPPTQPPALQMAAAGAPVQPAQQVIPAAFNQPVAMQPTPAAGPMPSATTDANTSGPWRSPQVPNSGSPVMQAQYVQPQQLQPQSLQPTILAAQPQSVAPATAMPVQLRAVPAPATAPMMAPTNAPTMMQPISGAPATMVDPTLSPPPRMRFPSWTEPSTWFTPQPARAGPPPGQQLVGYMVPGPNGQQQMVSVEQYQAMTGGAPQGAPAVANSDGFRPRGTTTK